VLAVLLYLFFSVSSEGFVCTRNCNKESDGRSRQVRLSVALLDCSCICCVQYPASSLVTLMVVIALGSFLARSATLVYTSMHVGLHLHGKHSIRGLGKSQDSHLTAEPCYDNNHLSCEHGGINLLLFLVLTNVNQSF